MAQNEGKKGAWVVISGSDIVIENSEMKALRLAVDTQGTVEFVEWGCAVGDKPKGPKAPKAQASTTTVVQGSSEF